MTNKIKSETDASKVKHQQGQEISKWVKSTYINGQIRILTKTFKNTDLNVALKVNSTMLQNSRNIRKQDRIVICI